MEVHWFGVEALVKEIIPRLRRAKYFPREEGWS